MPLLSPAGAWRFWSPVDFAAVVPEGVACLLCRLLSLPSVYFSAPYPPDPLPQRGRGRLKVYFAGGSAPGTPALNRLQHLQNLPSKCPAEDSLLGIADCPPPALAERSSPAGKGESFWCLMQGASPLASPGLNPGGTGAGGESRAGGGLAPALLACPAADVSGGVACLLYRLLSPAFTFFFAPIPPTPFPAGRGRF